MNRESRVFVGFIIFGRETAKYLPSFLGSLKRQVYRNFKIIAFNNGDEDGSNSRHIKESGLDIFVMGDGGNKGFSAAYNMMIREAVEQKADYFWISNPDIVYNEDVLDELVSRLDHDAELGSVCPKLLKWDFDSDSRTETVDTYGIEMRKGLRFFDVGQGQPDRFDFRYHGIIGPSGASGLYRLAALEKIKEDDGYFDESFFMYKEDCDLDYRLMLAEWETAVVPEAVGWHDRTAKTAGCGDWAALKARYGKGRQVRIWSFKNQQIIFWKYWKLQDAAAKIAIIIYQSKVLAYAVLFEKFLLKELISFWREKGGLKRYG